MCVTKGLEPDLARCLVLGCDLGRSGSGGVTCPHRREQLFRPLRREVEPDEFSHEHISTIPSYGNYRLMTRESASAGEKLVSWGGKRGNRVAKQSVTGQT